MGVSNSKRQTPSTLAGYAGHKALLSSQKPTQDHYCTGTRNWPGLQCLPHPADNEVGTSDNGRMGGTRGRQEDT
jgi:hypothetical protein